MEGNLPQAGSMAWSGALRARMEAFQADSPGVPELAFELLEFLNSWLGGPLSDRWQLADDLVSLAAEHKNWLKKVER
ncbi:MAG: hypothetical protein AMXMBFR33_35660 [Candidatus Xenobia bacterium]